MQTCFFCELKEKTNVVFKDSYFFGYFDDSPINPGHLIIISNDHIKDIFSLSLEEQQSLFASIAKAKEAILHSHNPDGYNIVVNEGLAAGKMFSHLVIHVIPRYVGDSPNAVATGARAIRGIYIKSADVPNKYEIQENIVSAKALAQQEYHPENPNKRFYLGLKALIRNDEGKILAITRVKNNQFIGTIDIPGGRCEDRDKEEYRAVQREVFEEIGVTITKVSFFDTFIFWDMIFMQDPMNNPENKVGLILNLYLGSLAQNNSEIVLKQREGIEELQWLWPSELADGLTQYPMRIRQKIKELEFRE